jgi:hypothetical protein
MDGRGIRYGSITASGRTGSPLGPSGSITVRGVSWLQDSSKPSLPHHRYLGEGTRLSRRDRIATSQTAQDVHARGRRVHSTLGRSRTRSSGHGLLRAGHRNGANVQQLFPPPYTGSEALEGEGAVLGRRDRDALPARCLCHDHRTDGRSTASTNDPPTDRQPLRSRGFGPAWEGGRPGQRSHRGGRRARRDILQAKPHGSGQDDNDGDAPSPQPHGAPANEC